MANNSNRKAIRFMVQGALPPHDVNVLWMDTSIKNIPILKIFENGAWVAVQNPAEYDPLKPGDNIIIEDNVISAIQPDVSNFVTKEELEEAITDTEDTIKEVSDSIPKVKNELIYSDDNETLTSYPLLYEGGLIVNTLEDLERCKLSADVALSEVINWHRFGGSEKADWYEYETRKSTDLNLPEFKFRGEIQDYIFNHQNPSNTTGFVSPDEYSDYDVFISMGILNAKKNVGATDYIGYIAAVKYDSTIPKYWGLSISAHTMNDSDKLNRSGQSTSQHTISVQGWIQANETGSTTTGVSLLSTSDGNLIIPYDSDYNNNDGSHQASSMLCRIKRSGSIINAWFSDPYYTNEEEGDAVHMSELHYDRTLTIDLANYTVSFIDLNGSLHSTSYANNATVVEIFDNIVSSARRGYEQRSNPGSIFRLCNTDEIILDVTPGEDKVYKFNGNTWEVLNTTPQLQFKSGSRISWNRVTNKLFYNDGATIKQIAGDNNSGTYNIGRWCKEDSNSVLNIGIGTGDNNRKNALQVALDGNIYIFGIGGYDGTNADSVEVQSLQQYLQSI